MKAAILDGNTVINIAKVADPDFAESQGWIVSDIAKIGDTYVDGQFTTPSPEPEPVTSISRRQGKQQLVLAGLDEQVQQAIDAIIDNKQRKLTRIWYDDSETWERDNAQLLALADALSLTPTQVDDLFASAHQL